MTKMCGYGCGWEEGECDCQERIDCEHAGDAGHRSCGLCQSCYEPLFLVRNDCCIRNIAERNRCQRCKKLEAERDEWRSKFRQLQSLVHEKEYWDDDE